MEADAVLDFVGKLNSSFSVSKYELINKDNKPPFVVIMKRLECSSLYNYIYKFIWYNNYLNYLFPDVF